MVASATGTESPSAQGDDAPPQESWSGRHGRERGGVRRMLASLTRVVDLQYRIWLTQAKMTLQRMVLFAMLFGVAALVGLLAIIFLYIGVFHLLTDVAGIAKVWAYLIYGGAHLVAAVVMVMVGASILNKKEKPAETGPHASKGADQ